MRQPNLALGQLRHDRCVATAGPPATSAAVSETRGASVHCQLVACAAELLRQRAKSQLT